MEWASLCKQDAPRLQEWSIRHFLSKRQLEVEDDEKMRKDSLLERIEAYNEAHGGGVLTRRVNKGYSLYQKRNHKPIARFRPTGKEDEVEILWWSHRDRWETVGDFGGIIMPLDEALDYVREDPCGFFWR